MNREDDLLRENHALRERLSRLSEASLRINESLDFDTVLQGVLDSARALTQVRYGVITLLDESGRVQDFLSSGLTQEVSAVVERARARWEDESKYPAHERPAPPARRRTRRGQRSAQASTAEGEADQQQPETLRLF